MRLSFLFLTMLFGCNADETLSAYGAAEREWRLTNLNDAPFNAQVILTFPEPGKIAGRAPCNSFSAAQTAPYPWFEVGAIASTKRACADLDLEQEFFTALKSMTISEVSGDTLILSNDAKERLVFKAN